MNAKTTKKIQDQFNEAVKNPQEFASNLNEKNQEFSQEIQSYLLSLPQEFLNQQKDFQEKFSVCAAKVKDIVTKQPIDYIQLQQTFLQFQTDTFANQAQIIQDNVKKSLDLFKPYSK